MTNITCPYCEKEIEIEDSEMNEQDETYACECSECGKTIGLEIGWLKVIHEIKMPCRNGEDHNWKPITSVPACMSHGILMCSHCGERKNIDPEGRKKAIAEYFDELNNKQS